MTRFSRDSDRTVIWRQLLKMPSFSAIQLKIEIAGSINKFQISTNVMKELLNEMFSANYYMKGNTTEALQQMRDNFFEILKNTIWFRDFEKCILKQLNLFWHWHENLPIPNYWLYGGPSNKSFDDLVKIRDFLMKKLQLDADKVNCL